MKYVILNNTDLNVSNICLGTASFGDKLNMDQSFEILDAFVAAGGNFIDTANVYCKWIPGLQNCSEHIIGEWRKSRKPKSDIIIATKGGHYSFQSDSHKSRVNRTDITADLEESLRTLGLDTIDYYLLHRDDVNIEVEGIVDILEDLCRQGKIRYYGFSNYKLGRLIEADHYIREIGKKGVTASSNQWSLASVNAGKNTNPDPTLVEVTQEEYLWHMKSGTALLPYSSTATGFFSKLFTAGVPADATTCGSVLSDAVRMAYWNEDNLAKYGKLLKMYQQYGYSMQVLTLAYFSSLPFQTIPITSVSHTGQIEALAQASGLDLDYREYGL